MVPSRFGYWALLAAAAAIAVIGVVTLVWGWRIDAAISSAGSSHLMIGGVVLILAGGYAVRWLLERG